MHAINSIKEIVDTMVAVFGIKQNCVVWEKMILSKLKVAADVYRNGIGLIKGVETYQVVKLK